jgi:hypothetical protein
VVSNSWLLTGFERETRGCAVSKDRSVGVATGWIDEDPRQEFDQEVRRQDAQLIRENPEFEHESDPFLAQTTANTNE